MDDGVLRIGEVARLTGLTVRTLHHYDDLGLLVPSGRTTGDHRLYARDDLRRLLSIQHLRSLGLSLAEVKAALDDPGFDPAATLDDHIALVEQRLAAERELLDRLRALRDAADAGWQQVVDAIALSTRLRHPEPTVRVRAALDPAGAPLPTLVERLVSDPDPSVRETLIWAVARHGAAAVPPLVARLAAPDPVARSQLVRALGKLGDRRAVADLVPLLDDPDPGVQADVVFALGHLGGPVALAALGGRLGEPGAGFGAPLTDAVARFGEDAVPVAVDASASGVPAVRLQAVEVLARIGSGRAVHALAGCVTDPDPEVRLVALFAAAQRPGEAADVALAAAAASPDPRLRALADRLRADHPGADRPPANPLSADPLSADPSDPARTAPPPPPAGSR